MGAGQAQAPYRTHSRLFGCLLATRSHPSGCGLSARRLGANELTQIFSLSCCSLQDNIMTTVEKFKSAGS